MGGRGGGCALQNLLAGRKDRMQALRRLGRGTSLCLLWQRQNGCKGLWHNCDVGFFPRTLTEHFGCTQYQIFWEFTSGGWGLGGRGCWETEHKQVIRATCAHVVPMFLLLEVQRAEY